MKSSALVLLLTVAASAAPFGNPSLGPKPYGVLLLAYDVGGAWKTELGAIRSQAICSWVCIISPRDGKAAAGLENHRPRYGCRFSSRNSGVSRKRVLATDPTTAMTAPIQKAIRQFM